MFIEIQPYEAEQLSVRFKADGDFFSKILQAIKKVPGRVWVSERCLWTIPADRNACDMLLNNLYDIGVFRDTSCFMGKDCEVNVDFIGKNDGGCKVELRKAAVVADGVSADSIYLPDIQDILRKLDAVITAKHYCKRNSFVSRLAVKENTALLLQAKIRLFRLFCSCIKTY